MVFFKFKREFIDENGMFRGKRMFAIERGVRKALVYGFVLWRSPMSENCVFFIVEEISTDTDQVIGKEVLIPISKLNRIGKLGGVL